MSNRIENQHNNPHEKLDFFTPLSHKEIPLICRLAEQYFDFGNKKAVITENQTSKKVVHIVVKEKSPYDTFFKVAKGFSFALLIPPILFFVTKAIYRLSNDFEVAPQHDATKEDEPSTATVSTVLQEVEPAGEPAADAPQEAEQPQEEPVVDTPLATTGAGSFRDLEQPQEEPASENVRPRPFRKPKNPTIEEIIAKIRDIETEELQATDPTERWWLNEQKASLEGELRKLEAQLRYIDACLGIETVEELPPKNETQDQVQIQAAESDDDEESGLGPDTDTDLDTDTDTSSGAEHADLKDPIPLTETDTDEPLSELSTEESETVPEAEPEIPLQSVTTINNYEEGITSLKTKIAEHFGTQRKGEDIAKTIELLLAPFANEIQRFTFKDNIIIIELSGEQKFHSPLHPSGITVANTLAINLLKDEEESDLITAELVGISVHDQQKTLSIEVLPKTEASSTNISILWGVNPVANLRGSKKENSLPAADLLHHPLMPAIIADLVRIQKITASSGAASSSSSSASSSQAHPVINPNVAPFLTAIGKGNNTAVTHLFEILCGLLGSKISEATISEPKSSWASSNTSAEFAIALTEKIRFWVPIQGVTGIDQGVVLSVGKTLKGEIISEKNGNKTLKFTGGIKLRRSTSGLGATISPNIELRFNAATGDITLAVGAFLLSKTMDLPKKMDAILESLSNFTNSSEVLQEFVHAMLDKYAERGVGSRKIYEAKTK